jgi:hypothetical protein
MSTSPAARRVRKRLLEGLMRIQDKIRGHKIARKAGTGDASFLTLGEKERRRTADSASLGYVSVPADTQPVTDHQKITG